MLAQVWFFHYGDVFALGGYVWLVLLRDLLVLAAVRRSPCSSYMGARRKTRIPSSSNTSCHSGFRRSAASCAAVGIGA